MLLQNQKKAQGILKRAICRGRAHAEILAQPQKKKTLDVQKYWDIQEN